jgi:hypothetical protein
MSHDGTHLYGTLLEKSSEEFEESTLVFLGML